MAAIQNLLARYGFVKLNRYGLVLTPEGRILSMRPAVLDDGLGSRIVGWEDSDLAAAELGRWEPAKPLVTPVASVPRPIARELVQPIVRPMPPPMPRAAATIAVAVAPKAEEPEDDWEWTIALARARAAAEEVELAAAPLAKAKPVRRTHQETVPPPVPSPSVKRTQPLPVAAQPRLAPVTPIRPYAQTIIPVPQLPAMTARPRFEPVVRPTSAIPMIPRRMAKGTGPVTGTQPSIQVDVGERTETSIELADQTRPNLVAPARAAR